MELKLEKKYELEEFVEGNRYSTSEYPTFSSILIVKSKFNGYIELAFNDGVMAVLYEALNMNMFFYEFPLTPLEQELL